MFSIIPIFALIGRFPVNFNDVTIKSFPNSESEPVFCLHIIQFCNNKVTSSGWKHISGPWIEALKIWTARENNQTLKIKSRVDTSTARSVLFVTGLTAKTWFKAIHKLLLSYHSMKEELHFSLPLHLRRAVLACLLFMWLHMKLWTWIASLALVHIYNANLWFAWATQRPRHCVYSAINSGTLRTQRRSFVWVTPKLPNRWAPSSPKSQSNLRRWDIS